MKHILLAVIGLSPQVLTETVYALHQSGRRVDTIHAITTRVGKERILVELLDGGRGHFYRYLKEYGFDPKDIRFGPHAVHVIRDEHGNEIPDISGEEDNERLLRLCLRLSFALTRRADTAVFFSVAGGRKTMSSCLTLAAQLYGRAQDRLYHVLVSPEFESSPYFYYPPRVPRTIELRDAKGHPYYKSTRYAEVNLIHIPFVSIRTRLSPEMLSQPADPATLMLSLVREQSPHLVINLPEGKITYRETEADLMPARLALYAFFALQKVHCPHGGAHCGTCRDCYLNVQEIFGRQQEITRLYRSLSPNRAIHEMSDSGIVNLTYENFAMYKGKIKQDLLRAFGPYALRELEIASEGCRPNTRYGIRLDRNRIRVLT